MTMKAHTYYILFGRPSIGGKLPLFPPGGATDSEYAIQFSFAETVVVLG